MLSENPEEAKNIILCEKPAISEDSGHIEPQLLDKLIDNISMLSSIYYKTPETFAKRVRDRINERLDLEDEGDGAIAGHQEPEDYVDSTGVKKSEYIKESGEAATDYNDLIQQDAADLMDLGGGEPQSNASGSTQAVHDLLGDGSDSGPSGQGGSTGFVDSLLDIGGPGSGGGGSQTEADPNYKFIPIPAKPLLQPNQQGSQNGQSGVGVEGCFERAGKQVYFLKLKITNNSNANLSDFVVNLNHNLFGVKAEAPIHPSFYVA